MYMERMCLRNSNHWIFCPLTNNYGKDIVVLPIVFIIESVGNIALTELRRKTSLDDFFAQIGTQVY